jgi:signal transduction histidine kinase
LDRLLRVLQPDERKAGAAPFAPTVADLHELVDRIRATGRQVDLEVEGISLTPGGARAMYRIVQEALTNAVRHSSAGRISVEVSQIADQVVVEVVNEGNGFRDSAPGRGLVNMRERARLEGGVLEAGPVQGGFRVHATLPAVTVVTP